MNDTKELEPRQKAEEGNCIVSVNSCYNKMSNNTSNTNEACNSMLNNNKNRLCDNLKDGEGKNKRAHDARKEKCESKEED